MRVYNFAAGPSTLPVEVLKKLFGLFLIALAVKQVFPLLRGILET